MPLSNKQRLFVEAYLVSWNATRAAIAAGYSEKTAYSIGAENLRKPEIAKAIQERIAGRAMSANEVLDRLAQQARGSIEDIGEISKYGTFTLDLSEAKRTGTLHLIKKIKSVMLGYEVELYDAQAALQLLGKHHKLFTEKVSVDGNITVGGAIAFVERADPGATDTPSGDDADTDGVPSEPGEV